MNWEKISLGPLQTNGFVLYQGGEGLMIDPGGDEQKLFQFLDDKGIVIKAVLLTHAHFDHIGGVEAVRTKYQCPVYVHKNEADWLTDPTLNGSALFLREEYVTSEKADHVFSKEGAYTISGFRFDLFETPGHSPGSVSYYFPEEKIVFSGDVLFHGGVGRTDLPGGDHDTLMNTLHEKMLTLPDETIVANGHGPETIIGKEKENNPFINGFGW
ncbi:MBL fold metallo-hydrolase [Salipaludibacillus sp. LMS25]|jgi:glyoxylase-like metal-dependent hydrolase (beta-lactamase superfamily II)|uniref:MBL fold metallo-hydrolase n=1 Tax=Salipaludibacillus sp. LMS25 TaxID=2924031 RepID=UPI0020D16CED|nr:MBL fold metallo-hydrolase [Salipaludibacillus sp. LMS25]UTR14447.1 MBL fold metallo-hydrolase [Salipaludibacillus sp. LMS25]